MIQIRLLNQGWGNYFKLSEAKSVFSTLDEWVRSRIRLCYWKQWKRVRTRIKQLMQLGVKPNQAYLWGNTRKGYWRTVHSPILTTTLNNAFLKKEGLLCLKDIVTQKLFMFNEPPYAERHVRGCERTVREIIPYFLLDCTRQYRILQNVAIKYAN
jgi:hypothetical protein